MKFYAITGLTGQAEGGVAYKDTLTNAHEFAKRAAPELVYRSLVRVQEIEIATDKHSLMELLNSGEPVVTGRGRAWGLTNRGGLAEVTGAEVQLWPDYLAKKAAASEARKVYNALENSTTPDRDALAAAQVALADADSAEEVAYAAYDKLHKLTDGV